MEPISSMLQKAKRAKNLLDSVADMDNLRLAVWKAAKGKRHSRAVLEYTARLEQNLWSLHQQLWLDEVDVGHYQHFLVYEPKERKICAPAFAEQVLHHALMNVCHPYFEKKQIFDSYASRKEKGTYAAIKKARKFTGNYEWYLKLDVRKFFESIHHEVLIQQLIDLFKDEHLVSIFTQIIQAYEASPQRGLPIGNLTSQYFANHYLTELDHVIKEKMQIKAYVRYMDDMVLWHNEKEVLKAAFTQIRDFVESKLLGHLKPHQLNRVETGLPFLGYHLFPHHVRLLQKSKQRFIKKMTIVDEKYHNGSLSSTAEKPGTPPFLN